MTLSSFNSLRNHMVEAHLRARGIVDERVLEAMADVPRHLFVPDELRSRAYDDRPLDIGHGQTISQPYMVALMTQELRVRPQDRVLEIGTGSGYQTAILSLLAAEVVTIERVQALALEAENRLAELGYENVTVEVGDGTLGCSEQVPFDGIMVTAGAPDIPRALKNQLADGGRLVCPVGPRDVQQLVVVSRNGEVFRERMGTGCVFVPLIGVQGWDG